MSVARTFAEIEEIAPSWRALADTPASDLDHYLATAKATPGFKRPHVLLLHRDGTPVALLAARLEENSLTLKIGYRRLWQPRARCLTVDPGAIVGDISDTNAHTLVQALDESLRRCEADVAIFHELPEDSPIVRHVRTAPRKLRRDGCPNRNVRWRLSLPDSAGAPLLVSAHTRRIGRYATKRLIKKYGERMRIETFTDISQLERMMRDLERVAAKTYQRKLGVGFVDDCATRERIRHQMKRRWFRAFVLYIDDRPCAFWLGIRYRDVYYAQQTGYDPDRSGDHVGKALLVWKLEALQREGGIRVVDWGFGDADYKSHFGTDRFEETTIAMFAPSLRGLLLNGTRTLIGGANALLKAVTVKLDVFRSLQARERRRVLSEGDSSRDRLVVRWRESDTGT